MVGLPFIRRFAANAVRLSLFAGKVPRPLIVTYFPTFRCNLSCTYCDYVRDGYADRHPELGTSDALRLLDICRDGVPSIAFSGGEPLMRKDLPALIRHARDLRFRPISLFTNGLLLRRNLDVLQDIDYLQISLDSADPEVQDKTRNRTGLGREVMDVVREISRLQTMAGFRVNLNCVLTPRTIDGIDRLLDFAEETGVRISCSPQLDPDGLPDTGLLSEDVLPRYRRAIDAVRSFKRRTRAVIDIDPFLSNLHSLRAGPCLPTLTPRVYPDGSLRLPCAVNARHRPNVLALGSWQAVWDEIVARTAPCAKPCLLPCYQEASQLQLHPWSVVQEFLPS